MQSTAPLLLELSADMAADEQQALLLLSVFRSRCSDTIITCIGHHAPVHRTMHGRPEPQALCSQCCPK